MSDARPSPISLIDLLRNAFYQLKQVVLILLVEQEPMLDFRGMLKRVKPVNGLVKIVADLAELFAELEHVSQEIVKRLVAAQDFDWLLQQYSPAVVGKGRADGF